MKVKAEDLEKAITKIVVAERNIDLWRNEADKIGLDIKETAVNGKTYNEALEEIRSYHDELTQLVEGTKETIVGKINKTVLSVLKEREGIIGRILNLNIDKRISDQIQKYYYLDSFANRSYVLERSKQIRPLYITNGIPVSVERKYREVILCFLEGRFSACCIMCRSVVEMVLKNLCAERFKRKECFEKESITALKDTCIKFNILNTEELGLIEKIRKMGNKSIHSEELSTDQEALNSISVLQQFLQKRFGV